MDTFNFESLLNKRMTSTEIKNGNTRHYSTSDKKSDLKSTMRKQLIEDPWSMMLK